MDTHFLELLSQGKLRDLLKGEGALFSPNPTYRDEHDVVYVMREALEWASKEHLTDLAKEFEVFFLEELRLNFKSALEILIAYFFAARAKKIKLDLPFKVFDEQIVEKINREHQNCDGANVRRMIKYLITKKETRSFFPLMREWYKKSGL